VLLRARMTLKDSCRALCRTGTARSGHQLELDRKTELQTLFNLGLFNN
jgi:hypothetical protein